MRNPRAFAESKTLTELRKILREADYAYHDRMEPLYSDEVYDTIRAVHDERAKSPYSSVGAVSSHAKRRVKLPVIMGSLRNLRSGTPAFDRIVNNGPFVVSDKEDGISLALIYEKGKLVAAYQRGNGTIGTDSSGVIPSLNVPHQVGTRSFIVRTEFTMKQSTFNRLFSVAVNEKGYDNPRNGSGGLLNRNKPDPRIKRMDVVCHEIMQGPGAGQTLSKQYALLKRLGFKTVPHKVYDSLTADKLSSLLKARKAKAKRMIDGIVVAQDKPYKIAGKYPDHAFAYKENSLDDSVIVTVVNVEWNASRYGKLSPRIEIEPAMIGGVTVRYLTGHNAFFIDNGFIYSKRNKPPYSPRPINKGAKLRAVRSGDVIPDIIEVVKAARKPAMPRGNVTRKGVDYILEASDEADVRQLVHFFQTLGVDGLKGKTVEKLMQYGYESVEDLLNAKAPDMEEAVGHVRALTIERNIRAAMKTATLTKLAVASSMFGPTMGERRLAPVFEQFPDAFKTPPSRAQVYNRILGMAGYSSTSAANIADTMPLFLRYIKALKIKPVAPVKKKVTGSSMANQAILFTSVRDAALAEWIVANSGKMATSVKNATALIIKEGASNKKTDEAEQRNVPIFTVDEFKKKFKVKL